MNTTEPRNQSEFTDEELLIEAKKPKLSPIVNALFIGFLVGIVFFSVFKSALGWFSILLLYIAYKLVEGSKKDKELEKILKERNLTH